MTNTEQKEHVIREYLIGGAIAVFVLIMVFSVKNIIADDSFIASAQPAAAGSGGNVANVAGGVQNAKMALVDFSYQLTPRKLVKGVPVRIEVDASTLGGCMKYVVIKDFGVRKTITSGDNIIEFTPDKAGTFWITCSMGMGPGSFEVVNPDGTSDPNAAKQAAAAPPAGGSCGAGGGGCGCGGR
ncbi:MAG TPA: hypothetical protein VJI75_05690 [Candidatus Nanoarchaeia archaeon]|nr:hypothetical protein [Candidatus Nanoarchaeia archaeon]